MTTPIGKLCETSSHDLRELVIHLLVAAAQITRVNTRVRTLRRDGPGPPGLVYGDGKRTKGGEARTQEEERGRLGREGRGEGGIDRGPAGGGGGDGESFRSHKSRVFGCVARRDGSSNDIF